MIIDVKSLSYSPKKYDNFDFRKEVELRKELTEKNGQIKYLELKCASLVTAQTNVSKRLAETEQGPVL